MNPVVSRDSGSPSRGAGDRSRGQNEEVERQVTRETVAKPTHPAGKEVNPPNPPVQFASDEQFRKAQKKTSKSHAGLFRLAQ